MAEMKSVCFFMTYHKRPELTRMSMFHMASVIKKFNDAGSPAQGIVVGEEQTQKDYAESLGLEHIWHANLPLTNKFRSCFAEALKKETDYVCWMGSNNLHSPEYIDKCIEMMKGSLVPTFGTTKFVIMSVDKDKQETCVFNTRSYHLVSSGQFYCSYTLHKSIDFKTVYGANQTCDFDGTLNDTIAKKWNPSGKNIKQTILPISSEPEDCLDIKDGSDIHSYKSYIIRKNYPRHLSRDEMYEKYEELQMLERGDFA
jgi:hypothetical protein